MELRSFGNTGLRVSELALGTMTFGRACDLPMARRLTDLYLDRGGNLLDTANVYGAGVSEEMLGEVLQGRRDKVAIATKVRGPMGPGPFNVGLSRRHILDQVDASLKRLKTDYIDVYQIHSWDPEVPIEETLDALDYCVRSGRVRYLGASNITGWQLAHSLGLSEKNGWAKFVSLQPEYNLISRGAERELLPACKYFGLACIPWSPLAMGLLTGKYKKGAAPPEGSRGAAALKLPPPMQAMWNRRMTDRNYAIADTVCDIADSLGKSRAQLALRWVMQQRHVTAPLIGAANETQLQELLGALEWKLEQDALSTLDAKTADEPGHPYSVQRAGALSGKPAQ